MPLEIHPNIRDELPEQFKAQLETRRSQRLVTALVVQGERSKKLQVLNAKLKDQHEKLGNECATLLAKIDDMFDKLDTKLTRMQRISSESSLIDGEVGE